MPWHGARWPGEFPSLGHLVIAWIEAHCVIPDRAVAGEPFVLSDEQALHLLWQFRLWPDATVAVDRPAAPFVYNGSLMVRSQKWGKAPFSSARLCAQAEGPVLFAGWAQGGERTNWGYVYEPGEPMGMAWATPHIQVAATADDQTENIWRALKPMIELSPRLRRIMSDTGLDRINLRGGGIIERVSSNATTRLGARIVYVEIDQPESMLAMNGGERLTDTLLRNVAGMGGRWAATGNAHDPSQDSVQQTWVEKPTPDVFIDYPEPLTGSWTNKRERRRILKHAYAGAPWVDIDRIEADCDRLAAKGDPGQAERWFGNRVVAGAAKAFDLERFKALERSGGIPAGRLITLGFDGAKRFDSTGLVATDVKSGLQVVVAVWERPLALPEQAPWGVPITELDEAVDFAFGFWRVWRMYPDPPFYVDDIARWAGKYGDDKVVEWWTNRTKQMAYALREYHESLGTEDTAAVLSHGPLDDSPESLVAHAALVRHVGNAVRRATKMRDEHGWLWTISKDAQKSVRKIDLAMASCLSWTARQDAIRAGALNPEPEYARAAWQ